MAEADSQIVQEITKLEHDWMTAVAQRDAATLDRLLVDDFLISGWLPEGRLGDKQFYIADCLMPVDVQNAAYKFEGWRMRAYGETVIATCRLEYQAIVAGQAWGGAVLLTDVWIKEGGSWRMAARHSSPVIMAPGDENR